MAKDRTGGSQGQNLPVALPGPVQKIKKMVCARSEIADTRGRGQGEDRQQDAAATAVQYAMHHG